MHRLGDRTVTPDWGYPQFSGIPRHVGMAPLDPRQKRAVGAEPRRGVEIPPARQHSPRPARLDVQRDDAVPGFAAARVVFSNTDDPPALGVPDVVGITKILGG